MAVAHFWAATLPAWAGAATVALAAGRQWLPAASWAAMAATAVAGPWRPRAVPAPAPATSFRLAMVNALFLNRRPRDAAESIAAVGADVCVVVELTTPMAEGLAGRWPHEHAAPADRVHVGIGLYSRFPFTLLDPPQLAGRTAASLLRARVDAPGGPVVLHAVHLRPPWRGHGIGSGDHLRAIDTVLAAAAAEDGPAVVAGDLNLPDRSQGYRRLAAAMTDAMRARWAGPTYRPLPWRPAFLRIDHLFVPRRWGAADPRRVRVAGSDHVGIVATVGPAADRP